MERETQVLMAGGAVMRVGVERWIGLRDGCVWWRRLGNGNHYLGLIF